MKVELLTKEDLLIFEEQLLKKIEALVKPNEKKWVKTDEARRILNCSVGTLQNLRVSGKLPFSKVGGTVYYNVEDINRLMTSPIQS